MRFLQNILKWRVARYAESVGLTLVKADGSTVSMPYVLPFPDFQPSILASLVTGSTASQSGNTVTVVAPNHGVVGNASKNGFRIYYPGSASIPAGWYSDFSWVDANMFTFSRTAAATVVSESVNGGGAFTSRVTVATSSAMRAYSLGLFGDVTIDVVRSASTVTGAKVLAVAIDGSDFSQLSLNSTTSGTFSHSLFALGSHTKQVGTTLQNGAASSTNPSYLTIDMTQDKFVTVMGQLQAQGIWMSIEVLGGRVTKR